MEHQKQIRKYEELELSEFYFPTVLQSPEAELALWQEDIRQAIDVAIVALPEKCREIFVLSKFDCNF